ncbi:uncharacterized protein N7473_007835 [Penicillium subrubescens]|uniref:uncharacterized protein n=1 Tax=Penicillium subrubescens TaxID=1316194 RepID=UPI002545AA4E|nr:uncharacterized protein N7473_007835 [Penicillium subrubescens]KAJ5891607.1 hypothetical protein N7473_007835 [Penicillium subrubescens]
MFIDELPASSIIQKRFGTMWMQTLTEYGRLASLFENCYCFVPRFAKSQGLVLGAAFTADKGQWLRASVLARGQQGGGVTGAGPLGQ